MLVAADNLEMTVTQEVPIEATLVMSALEAGAGEFTDRRALPRFSFRRTTQLRLFRDGADQPPRELFTRDINRRGAGFITRNRLPLGYGGTLVLPDANQKLTWIHCTLFRCREASPGWYEGFLGFNREQPQFNRA